MVFMVFDRGPDPGPDRDEQFKVITIDNLLVSNQFIVLILKHYFILNIKSKFNIK